MKQLLLILAMVFLGIVLKAQETFFPTKEGTVLVYQIFDKFSSDVNSSAMGIKMKSSNIDWYAKGLGMVKSESYDKNGKLQSRTELIEMH